MRFTIQDIQFHVLPMRTRFPFKYGIASMSALPHLFITLQMIVDGKECRGIASEGLPPKWFTKDPATLFEHDLAEMLAVIQNAARIARHAAARPIAFFPWWQELNAEQKSWAHVKQQPALLAGLGASLLERAVIDGLCRASGLSLHQWLATPHAGIDLAAVRPALQGISVSDVIAAKPAGSAFARHTVGLGDPLDAADVPAGEALDDGLPYTLEESIATYGLRYFKIKISGRLESDLPRLRKITGVLTRVCRETFHCTLDGNENFHHLADFKQFYDELSADPALAPLFKSLLLIEQPLHRNVALDDSVAPVLAAWPDGPGMIIDESDGDLDALPRALELGYAGTSHKNCKGIVKGIANAATLRQHGQQTGRRTLLSGEDLANVGPVALLQDLAMMAALGIRHVERNGHHYFRGLSMLPARWQTAVLRAHHDLYGAHHAGFPALAVRDGVIKLGSVNEAPFGTAAAIDPTELTPLKDWIMSGGMAEL